MKSKIKLTDLSHLKPLNDDMAYLKGGDNDPETGPLCFGCNCACSCTNPTPAENLTGGMYSLKRHIGVISFGLSTPDNLFKD